MKNLFFPFALCLVSLTASAQMHELVGMWQQLDKNGNPTTQVKAFMPDGKLLGLSYNSDFTNSSVWFMSYYDMLNELAYVDHSIYHSDIAYEHDYFFTYSFESDSVMVSRYADYKMNSHQTIMTERWKKMDKDLPKYTDAEWQALRQKSMAEFDRLPKEGQTVDQYASELLNKAEDYKKANKLDRAAEALLMRAALDTTNLKWQRDVMDLFVNNKMAPSVAELIADRVIRLTKEKVVLPSDTAVLNAYRRKAYLYNYRGNNGMLGLRHTIGKVLDLETKAGHQPSKEYGLDYLMMAESWLATGSFDIMFDNVVKAIDILEKSENVSSMQKGEAYLMKAMCLMNTDAHREAINVMRDKVIPHYVDEKGQPSPKIEQFVYSAMYQNYNEMLTKNPKDKKLMEEFRQFMADKLMVAEYKVTDKTYNLFGEYLVMEHGASTVEKPAVGGDDSHVVLLKDGKFIEAVKTKDGTTEMHFITVDAEKKKDIIKQWKAYKKGKKATK